MKTSPWPNLDEAASALREGNGEGVKIAVLDTGVDRNHEVFERLEWAGDLAVSSIGTAVESSGDDVYGHGTAIAGVIHQLAPRASIGSIRVLNHQLSSQVQTIAAGARIALKLGYDILHCSFSSGEEQGRVADFKTWIDSAYVEGRHVVAASHHQNRHRRGWPGHFPTVITVGIANTEDKEGLFYRPDSLVEFGARGHNVFIAWKGGVYRKLTGSSYAAPHVTGLLARLISAFPNLTPLTAKALLQNLAQPWEEKESWNND
ncbi:MAG: subtilisin family serine protease [Verrucomicrobiales bacterium]|jgi:subtilisin family serine protease